MNKQDFPIKKNPNRKRWIIIGCAALLSAIVIAGSFYYADKNKNVEIPLSEVILLSQSNIFSEMNINENIATIIVADNVDNQATIDMENKPITLQPKQKITAHLASLNLKELKDMGLVTPKIYTDKQSDLWNAVLPVVLLVLMIAFMVGLMLLLFRTDIMISMASQFKKSKNSISFADIGGLGNIKDSLMESVSFLRDRKYLEKVGAKIPHGVLLTGAPGVGKTMLARAMATEAGVAFYYCSGSELQSHWFGMTSQKIKKIFKNANNSPSIIFIDEIESIAQKRSFRGTDVGRDNDMSLNQLLSEMDGFDKKSNVMVIAATNHPEVLDPAILRPGRFDREIAISLPNFNERCEILNIHAKNKPLSSGVEINDIAKQTSGMSGADLASILNEASIIAGREHKESIETSDIDKALDRVMAGCERNGTIFTDKEKRLVAYHESGHALVAMNSSEGDDVQRISIIPHGDAGGFTRLSSENDAKILSKSKANATIAMLLGGRIAEEILIGDISSSAQNDLMRANQIAEDMVTHYGMGEKFKLRYQGNMDGTIDCTDTIDDDINTILNSCYDTAREIIENDIDRLRILANRLMECETLNAEEVRVIFEGEGETCLTI